MECLYERKLQSPERSLILSHGVTNVNKAQNHNSGQRKRQKIILYIIFYLKKTDKNQYIELELENHL